MLLLIVWIAVGVVAVIVLASVGFGLLGSLKRLGREAAALDRELRPVLTQAQELSARAGRRQDPGSPPA